MQARMPKVVLALLAGFIASTDGSGVQAQAPKGLEGTWTLNVAKSKFNPGPPPKSMKVILRAGRRRDQNLRRGHLERGRVPTLGNERQV